MNRLGPVDNISQHEMSLGRLFQITVNGAVNINTREVHFCEIDKYNFQHICYETIASRHWDSIFDSVRRGIWSISEILNENVLARTFYKPPKNLVSVYQRINATQVYLPPLNPLLTVSTLRDCRTLVRLDTLSVITAELYKCVCGPRKRFYFGCHCTEKERMASPGFDLSDLPWFGGRDW